MVHLGVYTPDTDLLCCHSNRLQQGLVEDTLLAAVGVWVHSGAHATVKCAVCCRDTNHALIKKSKIKLICFWVDKNRISYMSLRWHWLVGYAACCAGLPLALLVPAKVVLHVQPQQRCPEMVSSEPCAPLHLDPLQLPQILFSLSSIWSVPHGPWSTFPQS